MSYYLDCLAWGHVYDAKGRCWLCGATAPEEKDE